MAIEAAGTGTGLGAGGSRPSAASADEGSWLTFRMRVILVWVGIFAVLGIFFWLASFDMAWMRQNFWWIVKGVWVTITIAVASIFFAVILALLGALGRLSKNSIAYGISGFYTSFFRGTPLIVQMFLIYLALPQVGISLYHRNLLNVSFQKYFILSAIFAGIMALSLNYGAYMTEIFRAGILAVGPGQTEAADALGMSYRQRMRRVVLPQAFKVIIPPTGNEFIAMIKDTALVSFIASSVFWYDIFKRAQVAGNADFRNMEALILVAGIYWILTIIFTFFQAKLERRISKGYVRGAATAAPVKNPKFISASAGGGQGGGAMMVVVDDPEAIADVHQGDEAARDTDEGDRS
jgi:polar amino acid transport system permease protein